MDKATKNRPAEEHSPGGVAGEIESAKFKVFNRVAATKPLSHLLPLLSFSEHTSSRLIDDDHSTGDEDDGAPAFLHVASALQPEVFGIRVGIQVQSINHIIVVDASLEYSWLNEIDYGTKGFERFVRSEAAPRMAYSIWAIIEEIAVTLGADMDMKLALPSVTVADSVMSQAQRFKDRASAR